jgi:Domain of unknown function (DUF6894)
VNSAERRLSQVNHPAHPNSHTPSFVPTFTAQLANYSSQMPKYVFRIRQGTHSSDVPVDLADHDAAWHEGAKACSELIRDAVAGLRDSPEWRLEVSDETDEPLHLFRLTAETFKKE